MEIIAIDGPSGVGKSSASRQLARALGYYFFSSGILYRAMAWHLLQQGWLPDTEPDLSLLENLSLELNAEGNVLAGGKLVGAELQSPEVSGATSVLSTHPPVRERSNALQREVVQRSLQAGVFAGVIIEGRDIGTVVFPEARVKFYLTASPEIRAERRFRELAPEMLNLTLEDTLRDLKERDDRDASRALAPLKPADDAIVVDTSHLDLPAVVDTLLKHVRSGT